MHWEERILVRALLIGSCAILILGCGQKGPLMLPMSPAAAQRATLLQSLRPDLPNRVPHTAPLADGTPAVRPSLPIEARPVIPTPFGLAEPVPESRMAPEGSNATRSNP